jgi:hypothetical protein
MSPPLNHWRLTTVNPCQDKCLDEYLAEVREHWRRFLNGEIDAATRDALLAQSKAKFDTCIDNCGTPGS